MGTAHQMWNMYYVLFVKIKYALHWAELQLTWTSLNFTLNQETPAQVRDNSGKLSNDSHTLHITLNTACSSLHTVHTTEHSVHSARSPSVPLWLHDPARVPPCPEARMCWWLPAETHRHLGHIKLAMAIRYTQTPRAHKAGHGNQIHTDT